MEYIEIIQKERIDPKIILTQDKIEEMNLRDGEIVFFEQRGNDIHITFRGI